MHLGLRGCLQDAVPVEANNWGDEALLPYMDRRQDWSCIDWVPAACAHLPPPVTPREALDDLPRDVWPGAPDVPICLIIWRSQQSVAACRPSPLSGLAQHILLCSGIPRKTLERLLILC